ncbi:hypothetical protein B7486_70390, partial [cyanobacterium TDX16]
MDRSKVQAAIEAAGAEAELVRSADAVPAASVGATAVIVDLGRPGVLEALPQVEAPSVGFGRHDDT